MYEYKTIKFRTTGFFGVNLNLEEMQEELNKLGALGWELVSALSNNEGYGSTKEIVCILKKKI